MGVQPARRFLDYRSNLYKISVQYLEQISRLSRLNWKIYSSSTNIMVPTIYKIIIRFGETYVEQHERRIGKQLAGYARPFLLATGESSFRVISDN